jgi:hypothetical protein
MTIKSKYIIFCICAIALLSSQLSCKKNKFLSTGGNFSFSTDTLLFDTVFTSQGSVTKSFLLKNNNNAWVKINRIKLGKGNNSPFRLNVDGQPTKDITNINIAPFDSVYIFAAVTIDPTLVDNPFVVEDSVMVTLNETTKSLPLLAFGQNAIYIVDSTLQGNISWTRNKPIVIINSALVDSTCTLNIEAGTRVYMHNNSKLFVKGTLIANGNITDSILFTGDRLDRDYFGGDIPGEWCGLHFLTQSKNNILNYCTIKNGGAPWKIYNSTTKEFDYLTGALIYAEPNETGNTAVKLTMNNCFVGLSIAYGILAFNSNITATNCLYYACGSQNLGVLIGGSYNFTHCTFGNYGYKSFLRHDKYSVVALKNYFIPNPDDITSIIGASLSANFTNCIIDGNNTEGNEVFLDHDSKWPNAINFNHCLLKQNISLNGEATLDAATANLLNKNASFKEPGLNNFEILTSSTAKGAGVSSSIALDIKNFARSNPPSIGCWE